MTFHNYQPNAEEFAALRSYADEIGRHWKTKLAHDWYDARLRPCATMPNRGSILHGLRNHPRFGHAGLNAFRWPE